MLGAAYKTKKELKGSIGKPLKYIGNAVTVNVIADIFFHILTP